MNLWQRICPHIFGWIYTPSGRRKFCRMCAVQRWRVDGVFVDALTAAQNPWPGPDDEEDAA